MNELNNLLNLRDFEILNISKHNESNYINIIFQLITSLV